MQFEPAHIEHIRDVIPIIDDNSAFVVKQKGWYTVIDYMYMSDKMFHNPIERECRGLKFCTKTGRLIARPYHKFHNLNERVGYKTEEVDLTKGHVILDKLDGSMVHTCPSELGIYLMTRMGHTDVAKQAEKVMEANAVKFSRLFNSLPVDEYTYIFEYVGPTNKIVLDYKEEQLILTAIRHTNNGTYIFHDELVKLGKHFGIPVVDTYPIDSEFKLGKEEIIESVQLAADVEGIVIRFDTGAMVKLKADEYVRKHRSKDLVSSLKGMVSLILDNKVDDILPQLDEDVRHQVQDYQVLLTDKIARFTAALNELVEARKDQEQKEFALGIKEYRSDIKSLLFSIRKGSDAAQVVLEQLRRNCSTNKDINHLLTVREWPIWEFSFFSEE